MPSGQTTTRQNEQHETSEEHHMPKVELTAGRLKSAEYAGSISRLETRISEMGHAALGFRRVFNSALIIVHPHQPLQDRIQEGGG